MFHLMIHMSTAHVGSSRGFIGVSCGAQKVRAWAHDLLDDKISKTLAKRGQGFKERARGQAEAAAEQHPKPKASKVKDDSRTAVKTEADAVSLRVVKTEAKASATPTLQAATPKPKKPKGGSGSGCAKDELGAASFEKAAGQSTQMAPGNASISAGVKPMEALFAGHEPGGYSLDVQAPAKNQGVGEDVKK